MQLKMQIYSVFLYYTFVIMSCFHSYSILWIVVNNEEVVNLIESISLVHNMLPVAIGSDEQNIKPKFHDCVGTSIAIIVEVDDRATFFVA